VLRTRGPIWRSSPGRLLAWGAAATAAVALALPYTGSLAKLFGFVPMPAPILATALAIVIGYIALTEWAKRRFWIRSVR
jgi:P-type Mg2+ transporter